MAALQNQRNILLGESWACKYAFQCTSMMLGGLEKHMFSNGLSPAPTAPFVGFGYQGLVDKIRTFAPPVWYESKGAYHEHICTPSQQLYAQLMLTTDAMAGLDIYYYYS